MSVELLTEALYRVFRAPHYAALRGLERNLATDLAPLLAQPKMTSLEAAERAVVEAALLGERPAVGNEGAAAGAFLAKLRESVNRLLELRAQRAGLICDATDYATDMFHREIAIAAFCHHLRGHDGEHETRLTWRWP